MLIAYLDLIAGKFDLEPCDDDGEEEDAEPLLGSFDRMTDQSKSWRTSNVIWIVPGSDLDQDDADAEGQRSGRGRAAAAHDGRRGMKREEQWHRRHAIQLAAQLPEGKEDALAILQACVRLIEMPGFWKAPTGASKPAVVPIKGGKACD